jgi:hypothetical protein
MLGICFSPVRYSVGAFETTKTNFEIAVRHVKTVRFLGGVLDI